MAAGMAAAGIAAAAPARAATAFPYTTFDATDAHGALTGQCLEADPGPDFAYRVVTRSCNRQNPAQQWVPESQGKGIYKFANEGAGGWCLDAHVPTPSINGAPVILWSCGATFSDELWRWDNHDGYKSLHSAAWGTSNYCLDIPAAQTSTPGVATQVWTCNNTMAQVFGFFIYQS